MSGKLVNTTNEIAGVLGEALLEGEAVSKLSSASVAVAVKKASACASEGAPLEGAKMGAQVSRDAI